MSIKAKMTGRAFAFSEYFIEETNYALADSSYKDVKIILSDEPMKPEYLLNKVILAAASSFFRKLFQHEPKEVYEIGAVSKRGFEHILGWMYGQGLTVTDEHVNAIMDTARYLGCEEIAKMDDKIRYEILVHGSYQRNLKRARRHLVDSNYSEDS